MERTQQIGVTGEEARETAIDPALTPMRRQYLEIKARYPGMLLMFQIGDFFETFDEDAQTVARELGLALTRKWFGKNEAHPLAGVPVRSIQSHLAKLIQRGYKVALCEQVTLPGKGLVDRQVTRIITPGTVIEPALLQDRANNYLAAFVPGERYAGLAYTDVSTGEFKVTLLETGQAAAELERIAPAELVLPGDLPPPEIEVRTITRLAAGRLSDDAAREALLSHFDAGTLDAWLPRGETPAIRAAAALVLYLRDTQPDALNNLTRLRRYHVDAVMQLDAHTIRNLELFQAWDATGVSAAGSLIATLDQTVTSMGGRLLRRWLRHPLLDPVELGARQEAVAWFLGRTTARDEIRRLLEPAEDIERSLARIRRRLAVPAEVVSLARSLQASGRVQTALVRERSPHIFVEPLDRCEDIIGRIEAALSDRPPADFERGGVIRAGFNAELDRLRALLTGGRRFLAELEDRERTRTGIRSLKIGYNKVFGYYLEVTRPNLRLVPADFIRKQTLTNAERFFTLELKEHESLIANAKDRILELETSLFRQLCDEVGRHQERIRRVAAGLARIDVFAALAECAVRYGYVRPVIDLEDRIEIDRGRHPMIERALPEGAFIPNDTSLSARGTQIMLITAPNMAGKSIYLRQVALICLMAQIGSYVPAASARIGLVDRVFTRIGLNEYGLRGQSSFMLEMIETAHILHQASPRSLVLLDEVGRGTSTADGLAIARAVIEYLHNHPRAGARTLFATHYHELTVCAEVLPRVRNFHLAVLEEAGRIEYLHRVEPGRAEKSFGLHVAKLAGMPKPVLHRAQALIDEPGPDGASWQSGRAAARLTPLAAVPYAVPSMPAALRVAEDHEPYGASPASPGSMEAGPATDGGPDGSSLPAAHGHESSSPPAAHGHESSSLTAAHGHESSSLTTAHGPEGSSLRSSAGLADMLPFLETLVRIDLDALSPIEALTRLYELQREARALEALLQPLVPRR